MEYMYNNAEHGKEHVKRDIAGNGKAQSNTD